MSYEKICAVRGHNISYGEGEVLPWRVARGSGSGTYSRTPEDLAEYLKEEAGVVCLPDCIRDKAK